MSQGLTALVIAVVVLAIVRARERYRKADIAMQADAAKWDSATPEERQAINSAVEKQQDDANKAVRQKSARFWKTARWVFGIALALAVFIVVVTLLDAWHFVFIAACIGFGAWCLYDLIAAAVAEGIRRGRK